ncbi:MAG: exodeoxyribonuclease V subunit gamma, partial [Desulfocapsaceae bacterium]|nr:exodeoxyribonuclease V subunit gamma [Desulfocapsaceae bacterium]
MFIIHSSNRTEQLAGCLASIISRRPPVSLFSKELFLIQSRGMERMLSQYLAEQFGVWCNAEYQLPIQFIDFICRLGGIEVEEQVFNRDILTWQLEGILRESKGGALQPLSAYLSGEQSDLKRFQLARQLADIFDQYQIMRLDILQAWESDRTAGGGESEVWQKELWLKLRSLSPGVPHRGELIVHLINKLDSIDCAHADFPRRIFVFGLHTLPPLFLSVLENLSEKLDVHLFLLSPCELYWGDLESRKARARRLHLSETSVHEAAGGNLPFHPLLVAFGTQGAHFQELLLEKIDNWQDGEAAFADPLVVSAESPSLLLHLQADILAGSEPEKSGIFSTCKDNSIQVVSCHSRMRELMVLKDHILSWMQEDQSLELHEIIVMAPAIQEYALMIPAVFEDIQHSVADRNVRKKNRYYDTFMQFLSLLSGRYGWTELISILERPEVFPQFSLSAGDLETIRHWVISSGIRWGLSRQQRVKDNYMDSKAATWKAGLERMLMGYAIDRDETVADILPFTAIEGGDGELLGGLCRFVDVVEQRCFSFAEQKTLGQWSLELQSLCTCLFAEPEHPDVLAVRRIIAELEDKYAPHHDYNVSLQVIEAWLQSAVETGSSGGFLSGSLTFCSMLPMRSVPFRVICLLGLNDGEYP